MRYLPLPPISRTLTWLAALLLVLPALSFLSGCTGSGTPPAASQPYQTLAKDPRRDSEQASRQNAQALELIRDGKLEPAEQALKGALEADVTFGPAHNNLGKVYYQQGRYYLAAWEFQYAAKLMPRQAEPPNNLGLVLEATGKLDEAVTAYQKALGLAPENPQVIGNLVRARLRRGEKGPEVRELLVKLLERDTRPDWLRWAREKLALLGSPATQPIEAPAAPAPEAANQPTGEVAPQTRPGIEAP